MTTKQKLPAGVGTLVSVAEAQSMADKDLQSIAEVQAVAEHAEVALSPCKGQFVVYQVRRGHTIPMLVTAVHSPDLIDGVGFSARPSDVGNSYGSRGFQRVRRGEGDGQWLTSP